MLIKGKLRKASDYLFVELFLENYSFSKYLEILICDNLGALLTNRKITTS